MKKLDEEAKWNKVYKVFDAIINLYWPEEERIESEVEKIYNIHKGEHDWDEAWNKWSEDWSLEEEEWDPSDIDESLTESFKSLWR